MAKIMESLKKLSVEHGTRRHDVNRTMKRKSELVSSAEEEVSSKHSYILGVCGTQRQILHFLKQDFTSSLQESTASEMLENCDPEFRIGTALADRTCVIYSVGETLSQTATLTHNNRYSGPIVGIKFSPTSKNIVYTATSKGLITASDLRAKRKVVAEFKDNTEGGKMKPLASFDISCNERLVAGGTEQIGGDTFILFWDIRHSNSKLDDKSNLLGGYWESHTEDVTCLAFHSSKQDTLASGSTDGLINVFDLAQPSEELALAYSLNTESSVDRLGWLNDDSLWCTTYTHSLQLWDCDGATPYAKFERSGLGVAQNDDPDNCYVVRFHTSNTLGQQFLLAGASNVKGENLSCLKIADDRLESCYNIVGNKQVVRDSWLHEKSGCLVTAGEGGLINMWRQAESTDIQENTSHQLVSKIGGGKARDRQHRTKPY